MSKGLIALKRLKRGQYGTREQFNNQLSIIEKELKALEIIKDIGFKLYSPNEEDFGQLVCGVHRLILEDEEYELLKEVLL